MKSRFALCLAALTAAALGCGKNPAPDAVSPPPVAALSQGISWGPAVNGLRAGLSAKQTRFKAGKPMSFTMHLHNAGDGGLKLFGFTRFAEDPVLYCHYATLALTPRGGGAKIKAVLGRPFNGPVGFETLGKGESLTIKWMLDADLWLLVDSGGKNVGALRPGTYQAAAEYAPPEKEETFNKGCWRGAVASGTVEIEIVGPKEAK